MGTLTIVLDDIVERRLREKAARLHGSRKGALSASIQEAIVEWLRSSRNRSESSGRIYRAYDGRRIVAEAGGLRELAERLRGVGVDPREVEIRSSEPIKKLARMGMRLRAS